MRLTRAPRNPEVVQFEAWSEHVKTDHAWHVEYYRLIQEAHAEALAIDELFEVNAIFEAAIAEGRLSNNEYAPHYSGNYMLMGFDEQGIAMFKDYNDRTYLEVEIVYRKDIDWERRTKRRTAVDAEHARRERIKCDHHVFHRWLFNVFNQEQAA